ncbi:hypothetical protein KQI52_11240 [bacterium]|nr:hypothetical protein [bacterium]
MIVEKGKLSPKFKGFKDSNTLIEFDKGGTWKQAVIKFKANKTYMPNAVVTMRNNRYYIDVDGMGGEVMVTKPGSDNLLW